MSTEKELARCPMPGCGAVCQPHEDNHLNPQDEIVVCIGCGFEASYKQHKTLARWSEIGRIIEKLAAQLNPDEQFVIETGFYEDHPEQFYVRSGEYVVFDAARIIDALQQIEVEVEVDQVSGGDWV